MLFLKQQLTWYCTQWNLMTQLWFEWSMTGPRSTHTFMDLLNCIEIRFEPIFRHISLIVCRHCSTVVYNGMRLSLYISFNNGSYMDNWCRTSLSLWNYSHFVCPHDHVKIKRRKQEFYVWVLEESSWCHYIVLSLLKWDTVGNHSIGHLWQLWDVSYLIITESIH